jgi:hypothetical protein
MVPKTFAKSDDHGLTAIMTQAAEAILDDPETLKAMLISGRKRVDRIVAMKKDLRHLRRSPR